MLHYSTMMSWLGSRPLLTSQQLARRFKQVSETACSHMRAYAQQHEHMRAETHTHTLAPLVCLVAMVTQAFSTSTNLQMTNDTPEFSSLAQAKMLVRKRAPRGSNLTLKAWWINRIALTSCQEKSEQEKEGIMREVERRKNDYILDVFSLRGVCITNL